MKIPKITFHKYNWTSNCYRPSFKKYWSGKIWSFSVYKYGIMLDFRNGFKLTDLLTNREKFRFDLWWNAKKRQN